MSDRHATSFSARWVDEFRMSKSKRMSVVDGNVLFPASLEIIHELLS